MYRVFLIFYIRFPIGFVWANLGWPLDIDATESASAKVDGLSIGNVSGDFGENRRSPPSEQNFCFPHKFFPIRNFSKNLPPLSLGWRADSFDSHFAMFSWKWIFDLVFYGEFIPLDINATESASAKVDELSMGNVPSDFGENRRSPPSEQNLCFPDNFFPIGNFSKMLPPPGLG